MVCDKFTSLTGCNNCEYPVQSSALLSRLRSEAVARVCLYIITNERAKTTLVDYDTVRVRCSGQVTFSTLSPDTSNTNDIYRKNALVCGLITDHWYKVNVGLRDTLEGHTLKNVSDNVKVLSNAEAITRYFLCLVKNLRDLTICNGICDKVTLNKKGGECRFRLGKCSDIPKITNPMTLLEALKTAIYSYKMSAMDDACIDLSEITISCNGTAILPAKYVSTPNASKYLRDNCVTILKFWIGRHHWHVDAPEVLEIMRRCRVAKTCGELIQILGYGMATIEANTFFND